MQNDTYAILLLFNMLFLEALNTMTCTEIQITLYYWLGSLYIRQGILRWIFAIPGRSGA